ncbi:SMODS domain-containing nucleotidyltransferase [Methylobacterium sp. E-045]|uniref:SMODS domain-containing nucleotidyltransferase n=1 Tax=Methylobacterium sp. E-045 TaxID=2836575 RepID=UPI001FBAC2E7|nr:hypothetical protein [Methylobacterium sp. E-045]MCJ2127587.1 hypothetical protein [Methylobacterium sp. E-045]
MAKTVDGAFEVFASWLKATTTETAKAATHRRSIQGRLTTDFDLKNMFRSGSFGHDTGVSGYSDIDYFAVIPENKLKQKSGITLREVKESLQKRFPFTEIVVRSPAVIIPFGNSPSEKHEIVPADYVKVQDGHRIYDIPDRYDGWMRSSPAAHNKWVTDHHQRLNNKLKPLIRMIKSWNYYKDGGIRSFYLELRTTEYAKGESTIVYKFDVMRTLRHLHKKELAAMQDPKGISGYIHPCTAAVKPAALSKVETALTRAEKAMEAENKGNISDAFYWWNMVFSGKFPSYY